MGPDGDMVTIGLGIINYIVKLNNVNTYQSCKQSWPLNTINLKGKEFKHHKMGYMSKFLMYAPGLM